MVNNKGGHGDKTNMSKDGMALTCVKGTQSHQDRKEDGNQLRTKYTKLFIDLNNCNTNLLLHILDKESLEELFVIKPECHIKILENSFLNQTRDWCRNFQMKSGYCHLKHVSRSYRTNKSENSPVSQRSPVQDCVTFYSKLKLSNNFDFPNVNHVTGTVDGVVNSNEEISLPPSLVELKKDKDTSLLCFQMPTTSENFESIKKEERSAPKICYEDPKPKCSVNLSQNGHHKHHNEVENDFVFTIEEEKIVSFVCSPSPPRKFKDRSIQKNVAESSDSNLESDKRSERSSSKEDSVSDTTSNVSNKSNSAIGINGNLQFHGWPKMNNLLWQSPPQNLNLDFHPTNKMNACNYPSINSSTEPYLHRNVTSCHEYVNCNSSSSKHIRFKTSCSQETILFREASLRACNNLETLLKNSNLTLPNEVHEVGKVREAIFSAVRSHKSNTNLISDGILSVTDIVKSWIKLNSQFERDEFKNILESFGCDASVFDGFLQWQCASRILIDKIVHVLIRVYHTNTADPHSPCSGYNRPTHQSHDVSFSSDTKDNMKILSNLDFGQTENWQRLCLESNNPNQEVIDNKNKRLLRSKLTITNANNELHWPTSEKVDIAIGQGDSQLVSYNRDVNFDPKRSKLIGKLDNHANASGLPWNCSKFVNETSILTGVLEKNVTITSPLKKHLKEFSSVKGETNLHLPNKASDVLSCTNVMDFPVNYRCTANTQFIPTIPPLRNNQQCSTTSNQTLPNYIQGLKTPNPIYCIDTELGENSIKNNYMKPGSYKPPQKPLTCQKFVNNNLPIEDTPVVGIPFLYNKTQPATVIEEVSAAAKVSLSPTHSEPGENKCNDTWQAAMNSAETLRESMIISKYNSYSSFKVSETVAMKSHFLLSDDCHLDYSDNELSGETVKSTSDVTVPAFESDQRAVDLLSKPFDKTPSKVDTESSTAITKYVRPGCESPTVNTNCDVMCQKDLMNHKHLLSLPSQDESDQITNFVKTQGVVNSVVHPGNTSLVRINQICQDDTSIFPSRKPRKHKKPRDEYSNEFDSKIAQLCRNPKSMHKRPMTENLFYKLEDILNCISNADLSNLVAMDFSSKKDSTNLDIKVKCPIYIQTLKCKLANHNYDTLDQALYDFKQYFMNIKERNQGDKQCTELSHALERLFLNLVEKHFGLFHHNTPQSISPMGGVSSQKPRKPKKTHQRF